MDEKDIIFKAAGAFSPLVECSGEHHAFRAWRYGGVVFCQSA